MGLARHAKPDTTAVYTRTLARRLVAVVGSIRYGDEAPAPVELPGIGYAEAVTALEGPGAVGSWETLGRLLAARAGWRFGISGDGLTLSWSHGPDLWCRPEAQGGGEPGWCVNLSAGPGQEDPWTWVGAGGEVLGELLGALEAGEAPPWAPNGDDWPCRPLVAAGAG